MDGFNKIISFVLGLVVVLVFVAVITGRLNLKNKLSSISASKPTPAPISTQKPTTTVATETGENNLYKQNNQTPKTSTAKSIPAAGLPTFAIPVFLFGLWGGSLLRRVGKK